MRKALTAMFDGSDPRNMEEQLADLAAYTGGQVPGLNPIITIPVNWAMYRAGHNPYDYFRNRPILTNDEWLAGGGSAIKGMLKWTAGQLGIKNFVNWNPNADTTLQMAISMIPPLNSVLKISDYGHREKANQIEDAMARDRAKLRLLLPGHVYKIYREYTGLRSVRRDARTYPQQERYMELSFWYRNVFAPRFEIMMEFDADKKPAKIKAMAQEIGELTDKD